MKYSIEDYPHLVTIILTDAFGMSLVIDNLTGKSFRISHTKLSRQ